MFRCLPHSLGVYYNNFGNYKNVIILSVSRYLRLFLHRHQSHQKKKKKSVIMLLSILKPANGLPLITGLFKAVNMTWFF